MSSHRRTAGARTPSAPETEKLLEQYGCGPIQFTGTPDALYERHLLFDNVVDPGAVGARERYEAVARSVRDVLSQRWVLTEKTYERQNPKRVYYLSMEFLLGRSLANNITNLLLDPVVQRVVAEKGLDWLGVLEQEPDAGLGNGGLGRLAACFLDSMATMQLPAMGYGLRYEYGIFKQTIQDGWQQEQPDNWLRQPDPWEVARPYEKVDVRLNCSFEVRAGTLQPIVGQPSSLIGLPFDRPVVGYGGKTINTLRLWAAAAPESFDFQAFSGGEFVSALAERLAAESLTRVLYPDDSTSMGQALRFVQEYFLVACSLADLVRRFRRTNADWNALPGKVAIQLNDTHPALAVPELMRILLDEAHLGWDEAWDLTRQTLAYTNHTLLPEALEKWPLPWFEVLLPRHLEIILEINRRLLDEVRARFPGDGGRVDRVSLVEDAGERKIRMANLAIVGSHSTNGVAAYSLRTAPHGDGQGPGRDVPRALQQQDQRGDAAALAPAGQSGARRHHHRRHRRRLDHRPRPAPTPGTARQRRQLPRRLPQGQARGKRAVRGLAPVDGRARGGPGDHLRQPGQAHPRIQAAAAQRAQDRGALQPAARESRALDDAADVLLRRQGGAGLPAGQGHHQVPQQPGRHDRRRPRRARPAQGRVPAGVLRVARRAPDPRQRRLEPDLDRRLRGQRHQQHEVHDERRAHDRHPRRRHDRDGPGGGRGELLPVRSHRRSGRRQPRLVQSAVALRPRGRRRAPRST